MPSIQDKDLPALRRSLLAWYDANSRPLPWRIPPQAPQDAHPDPYAVWLSEIMLQQTTVAAIRGYYGRFLERFPTVGALAAADREEVLALWQGLGYYRRAHHLHRCAQQVVLRYGGVFPSDEKELLGLPGIGPYTASAIVAFAFGRRALVIDGNIERVLSRLFYHTAPLEDSKKTFRILMDRLSPAERPRDFPQALMDLAASLCTPRNPRCGRCPLGAFCLAHHPRTAFAPHDLPRRRPQKSRPRKEAFIFFITAAGQPPKVLIRKRPDTGLLAGLWEFPSLPWQLPPLPAAPFAERGRPCGAVVHVFTHFHLTLHPLAFSIKPSEERSFAESFTAGGRPALFAPLSELKDKAFPSLMKKVLRSCLQESESV